MAFVKLLFSFGLLLADLPVMDEEGWVTVPRPRKEAEAQGADERDPSIWVVFAKQIGAEKILIKFPDEPTYRYMDGDGAQMEVSAAAQGIEHRLQMFNQIFQSPELMLELRLKQLENASIVEKQLSEKGAELLYWQDGVWVQEKLIRTESRTFFLQTKSAAIERDSHRAFTQSFDLVRDSKFQ